MADSTPQLGYAPVIIVKNIIETFLPYRGVKYENNPSSDQIINDLYINGFFRIDSPTITVIVVDDRDDNPCYSKRETFKNKILNTLSNADNIIIAGNSFTNDKKNLVQDMIEIRREKKLKINIWPYEKFVYPIPYCHMVPPHYIMTDAEVEEMFNVEGFSKEDIKPILHDDTPIVWLGAVSGQYIRVENRSLTAGKSIEYYHIK